MSAPDSKKVEFNFSRGAKTYDDAGKFQNSAADMFSSFIRASIPQDIKVKCIMELGAGSGMMSEHLLELFPDAELLVTDISHAMLSVCREKLSAKYAGRFNILRHDFNKDLAFTRNSFDLVVSALALQWASDLRQSFANIRTSLKPDSGIFYFSIPLCGSFDVLRKCFKMEDLEFPGLDLPAFDSVKSALHDSGFIAFNSNIHEYKENYASLSELLRHFKLTGTSNAGRRVSTSVLRRMMSKHLGRIELNYKFAFFACEVSGKK